MSAGPEQVHLDFRFQTSSGADPDAVVGGAGLIDDITNSSGVYTITLAKEYRYSTLVRCLAGVEDDVSHTAQYTSYDSSTGALVVTAVLQDGTPAAGEPADNKWVHVSAVLCRRSGLAPTEAI